MRLLLPDWSLKSLVDVLGNALKKAPRSETVEAFASATINELFSVNHSLGTKPDGVHVSVYSSGVSVWATDEDRALWTDKQIFLRASAVSAKVQVTIFTYR